VIVDMHLNRDRLVFSNNLEFNPAFNLIEAFQLTTSNQSLRNISEDGNYE